MKRRHFIGAAGAAVAAVVSGAPAAARAKPTPGFRPCTFDGLPREIAGEVSMRSGTTVTSVCSVATFPSGTKAASTRIWGE